MQALHTRAPSALRSIPLAPSRCSTSQPRVRPPADAASRCRRTVCYNGSAATFSTDGGAFSEEPRKAATPPRSEQTDRRARLRGKIFLTLSMAMAVPLFCAMVLMTPLVALFDRSRRRPQHWINKLWAQLSCGPFTRVKVEGRENIPDESTPAVYCANHESYMDIFALFHLGKDFKFVSKTSIFLIPIVGWSMWLTGHIALNREDSKSFKKFIGLAKRLLAAGASVAIFPEGTRSPDGKLAAFKKGAFTIATQAKAKVVPITILGSGDVMPPGREGTLFPGEVTIVVHPPIKTKAKKTAQVADECHAAVASALPAWKVA